MIKISHEIPKQLFPYHDLINDYPYVLAHLLMKDTVYYDEDYAKFYKESLSEHTFSILDNAAFELNEPINQEILFKLGEEYKPSHLIIPDSLGNKDETINRCKDYILRYGQYSTPKLIGVAQGESFSELLKCCMFYDTIPHIDIVAIPFNYTPECTIESRYSFIKLLVDINFRKKVHLLGCLNPGEFIKYNEGEKKIINSIDTSAPIIYGWNLIKFDLEGCREDKPKEKLADNLNIQLNNSQLKTITHNIKQFRRYIYEYNNRSTWSR